jgi:hypothetical protein
LGLFVADLVAAASRHLDDAIEYARQVPEEQTGVRMFLIVPIFLATETLNAIAKNPVRTMIGPPVKISRADVMRLTGVAGIAAGSNPKLSELYSKITPAR